MTRIVSITGFKGFPKALNGKEYRLDLSPESTWLLDPPKSLVGYQTTHEDIIHYNMASGRRVASAPVYLAYIEDALVSPMGVVFTSNNDLIYESIFPWQQDNFASHFSKDVNVENRIILPRVGQGIEPIDEAFHAREGGETGYFHFINSILPKVAIYKRFYKDRKVPILISKSKSYSQQFLELLGVTDTIPPGKWYRVKRLFFPSPFIREGDHFFRPPYGTSLLRELFRDLATAKSPEQRVYLSRGDVNIRRLINESEVVSILEEFGFKPFTIGSMSVRNQIDFFSTVKHLVSPHGAGLSNMVFMPSGSSVMEILSTQRLWPTFRLVAARHDVDYHILISKKFDESQTAEKGEGNEDFWVDPKSLRMSIQQILL